MLVSGLIAATMAGGAIILFLQDAKNQILMFDPQGFMSDGSFDRISVPINTERKDLLGVALGMPADIAAGELEKRGFVRFVPPDTNPKETWCGMEINPPWVEHIYMDNSWRKASVCFVTRGDLVRVVRWRFDPLTE